MINLKTMTLGSDAEVFLRTLSGQPIPACGLFGGTKHKPRPLVGLGDGFAVQEDNAAMEFNIRPVPATHYGDFVNNIYAALENIRTLFPASMDYDKENSSLIFNEKYLQIPQMNVFGCEPDFNAWKQSVNPRPMPSSPGFRSAAAHVHVGWDDPNDDDRLEFVRLADVFVTCGYVPLENESEIKRRTLYGKAGAFRWKEYGIEHRVLGNRWIFGEMESVLRSYISAAAALNAGIKVEAEDYDKVVSAIDEHHTVLAQQMNRKYWAKLKEDKKAYTSLKSIVYS